MLSIGMKLDGIPTERVLELAPDIDAAGLDEIWICEDLGRNGGIAQAGLALAATQNARVGFGIAPAAVRNVAYFAMEIASLCRAYPGRFLAGIGHGMPDWLQQVGAHPGRLLPCLEEVTLVVNRLLRGESVTFHGEYVHIDDVRLRYPPSYRPPISLGVRGPRGVELAKRVADGLILAEGSGPAYVRKVRERTGDGLWITVFTWFSIDADSKVARERLGATVGNALEQDFMQAQLGHIASEGPTDAVLRELTVSGDAGDCLAAIRLLQDAGADAVVLQPVPGSEAEQLEHVVRDVLPAARGREADLAAET